MEQHGRNPKSLQRRKLGEPLFHLSFSTRIGTPNETPNGTVRETSVKGWAFWGSLKGPDHENKGIKYHDGIQIRRGS
jgi:hypothetical protein